MTVATCLIRRCRQASCQPERCDKKCENGCSMRSGRRTVSGVSFPIDDALIFRFQLALVTVADHSVPSELKQAYPGGKVRASCGRSLGVGYGGHHVLGDPLKSPAWWDTAAIMRALHKIFDEKVRPSCSYTMMCSTWWIRAKL